MITQSKPFNIDKRKVYEAYLQVRSNGGAAGVDGMTIEQFEADLKSNLYKIWNRMSSGAYFPRRFAPSPFPSGQEANGPSGSRYGLHNAPCSVRVWGDEAIRVELAIHSRNLLSISLVSVIA